jgi:hypothetical protein
MNDRVRLIHKTDNLNAQKKMSGRYWLTYTAQFWALLGWNEIVWIASCNNHGHKAAYGCTGSAT